MFTTISENDYITVTNEMDQDKRLLCVWQGGDLILSVMEPNFCVRYAEDYMGSIIVTYDDDAEIVVGEPFVCGRARDGREIFIMRNSYYSSLHKDPPDYGDDLIEVMLR